MGGVQFSTLYLAQQLRGTQWNLIVVCPLEGELPRACREAGITLDVLDVPGSRSTSLRVGKTARIPNPAAWAWNLFTLSTAARKLKRVLAQRQPALVVTKGLLAHFFGGLAARRLGIPCVWHVQDLISERSFGIYRHVFGRAARWLPEQIIVDGAAIVSQLPSSLQSRISVVHNGVDIEVFHPRIDGRGVREELGIRGDQLVVGHVGRVTPWKGQHYLIEAFASIADKIPNAVLLLVGSPVFDNDAYQRRLLSTVAQLGLKDRVKFAGYRHDMPQVLAAMDAFAFTSIEKDTSPLALLSAMACGLPILAFDIAGVRELMANEDQFRLVPVADVPALARALAEVLSDRGLRQRLGAVTREQAVNEFSLAKCAERIQQVFRVALSNEPANGATRVIAEVDSVGLKVARASRP